MGLFNRKKKTEEPYQGKLYLLSPIPSMETVLTLIGDHFGIDTEGGGNTLTLHNGDMEVQVLVAATDLSDEAKAFVQDQLDRIWGHFYQVEADDTDIKLNLLYQLKMTKAIAIVDYSFDTDGTAGKKKMIETMFTGVLDQLNAVLLLTDEDDGVYRCGENGGKQLILSGQGHSELSEYLYEQEFEMVPGEHINQDQIDRRLRSRAFLKEHNIFVPAWYPVIEREDQTIFRATEEIAGRAAALLIVAIYSECLLGEGMSIADATEFIDPIIERFDADKYFSQKEKDYLNDPDPSESDRINYSWQYENLYVMEWALGLQEELDFPDHICDVPMVVRVMKEFESIAAIVEQSKPRSSAELMDQCDLIFCLDWACVDTRVKQLPAPCGMEGGVVMERHKSLNWLTGYNEHCPWDEVTTDT